MDSTFLSKLSTVTKGYENSITSYNTALNKYHLELPITSCSGATRAAKSAKSIMKSAISGPNQWLSRVLYGAFIGKKNEALTSDHTAQKSGNFQLDPLSIMCNYPTWEFELKSSDSLNFISNVFPDKIVDTGNKYEKQIIEARSKLSLGTETQLPTITSSDESTKKSILKPLVTKEVCQSGIPDKYVTPCLIKISVIISEHSYEELTKNNNRELTRACLICIKTNYLRSICDYDTCVNAVKAIKPKTL